MKQFTICCYDFSSQQVIDCESILAHQVSNPASQSKSTDSNRASIPETGGKSMRSSCRSIFAGRQSGFSPGCAVFLVDLQVSHIRKIQHNTAICHTMTNNAMTAAANGEFQSCFTRNCDHSGNIISVLDSNNYRRTSINAAIEHSACFIVIGIA